MKVDELFGLSLAMVDKLFAHSSMEIDDLFEQSLIDNRKRKTSFLVA